MDMKRYEFKDSRPIFKWIYIILLLNVIRSIITVIEGTVTISYTITFLGIYAVIAWVTYTKTRTRVYIDEKKIELKKVYYYMMITEIEAEYDVIIKADGQTDRIGIYDLEKNYDEYKELLEYILQRVDKKVAIKAGSSEKILETIKANGGNRYSKDKLADGRVKLGGFLKFFNVMAYIIAVLGVLGLLGIIIRAITGAGHNENSFLSEMQISDNFLLWCLLIY